MSSLYFQGNSTSYLSIPNTNDLNFGTGDFTIEWYQYQTDTNSFPRIFQIGNYPSVSIGVSIEGGQFYYWTNGTPNSVKVLSSSEYKNIWVHFAISRYNGITKIFMDGTSIFSMNDTNNFNSANILSIANESTTSNSTSFGGYITYFTWVKGISLYRNNFTVSNTYPSVTDKYILLLKAYNFDGTIGNTVVNSNVTTINIVPPNFLSNNNNISVSTISHPKTLFTNNSMVFYKPGSLASCGVGSVRNSNVKSKRV